MARFNRREVSFAQARAELNRTLADQFDEGLPEPYRGERLARIARELQSKYPDLDESTANTLVGEGVERRERVKDPV